MYAFCFLRMFCVWMFLFFNFIFSITMPPVQTLNPIGKKVPNPQFWVSLLLKDTRCFGKAKDCLFGCFVSFFKFCFLNIFGFISSIKSEINFCAGWFFSPIWGFILCKESFRARNCRDLELCFIFLRIRIWLLKLPVIFSKQFVNRRFFLACYFKVYLWFRSSH